MSVVVAFVVVWPQRRERRGATWLPPRHRRRWARCRRPVCVRRERREHGTQGVSIAVEVGDGVGAVSSVGRIRIVVARRFVLTTQDFQLVAHAVAVCVVDMQLPSAVVVLLGIFTRLVVRNESSGIVVARKPRNIPHKSRTHKNRRPSWQLSKLHAMGLVQPSTAYSHEPLSSWRIRIVVGRHAGSVQPKTSSQIATCRRVPSILESTVRHRFHSPASWYVTYSIPLGMLASSSKLQAASSMQPTVTQLTNSQEPSLVSAHAS